ncbi:MAG: N-acetylmuramoyl-L-alanine amidase [Xenococcaceae cyanobacterium]
MKKILGAIALAAILIIGVIMGNPVTAQTQASLILVYPPAEHQTTASSIFLIGTAPDRGNVLVNDRAIERSKAGHFAPSFPLQIGENLFTVRYKEQEIQLKVTRNNTEPEIPTGLSFAKNSLIPASDMTRLPGELICFRAIAPPQAEVSVSLGDRIIPLLARSSEVRLPLNSALLNSNNQPGSLNNTGNYQGCTAIWETKNFGRPLFQLSLNGQTITEQGLGSIEIIAPDRLKVVKITADVGITRTGASSNSSRLTPLPKGTHVSVTGSEGEWLRLDYGAWIKQEETQIVSDNIPPTSIIRSIKSQQKENETEIIFPLQVPVPISVQQGDKTLTLTLYNTTAETDTIRLNDDPIVKRLDWRQISPTQIDYTFNLKSEQQWGYDLKYQGTSLILSLRHPPKKNSSLKGIKILLDPGHGGEETGAKAPTGYTEKDANLLVAKSLQKELQNKDATVYMTREEDKEVSLEDRVRNINEFKPNLAISLHYNALPDDGDAINTKGISTFWYHPQAHSFAVFLHNYLVDKLGRHSYGVFWNNLALTRPHTAPSILLEMGFIINPEEFEWISDRRQQEKLAEEIANGIEKWFDSVT